MFVLTKLKIPHKKPRILEAQSTTVLIKVLYKTQTFLGEDLIVFKPVLRARGEPVAQSFDPFEMMLAFTSFMGQNVLERFPDLNIGYLGAGVGWIPYWLDRVDEHWGGFFGSDAQSTQAPSLLFKTQGFASADPWEKTLPEVLEECGESTIVWGSQYPFPEVAPFFPNELDTIVNEKLLTEDQKKAVLWDNAAKLFGISG